MLVKESIASNPEAHLIYILDQKTNKILVTEKQLEKMKEVSTKKCIEKGIVEIELNVVKEKLQKEDQNIKTILNTIRLLNIDVLSENLEIIISQTQNYSYEKTLILINLEIIKTLKELKELLKDSNITKEEKEYIEEEIKLENKRKEIISKEIKKINLQSIIKVKKRGELK